MITNSAKVRQFHWTMGLVVRNRINLGDPDERVLRVRLIEEELGELKAALHQRRAVAVADALADLLYVVYGAAVQFGIPIEECFNEVHRSNMTKTPGYKDPGGKLRKGPNYQPPNLQSVLDAFLGTME